MTKRFAKALASAAILGSLAFGAWTFADSSASIAGGETRTLSFYHVHTKEALTVTYMRDGRYVPSEMKKVNRVLRDWRRNEVIIIDPKTLDLVWALHADLGSQAPVHIVSGYRSPRTNAFLRKIGRKVAKKSQHMKGKAIDFYFPDVPTIKIRNSALYREVGGVGYYRSSSGPTGFLHVDSGNVRHWGPAISPSQMASIKAEGRKTFGKRLQNKTTDMLPVQSVAETGESGKSGGLWGLVTGKRGKPAVPQPADNLMASLGAYDGNELAQYSQDAADSEGDEDLAEGTTLYDSIADAPSMKKPSPVGQDTVGLASMAQTAAVEELANGTVFATAASGDEPTIGYILKPRLKPRDVQQLASAALDQGITIEPANAPPESQSFRRKPSPVATTAVAAIGRNDTITEDTIDELVSNADGKTSFADIRDDTSDEAPATAVDFATASFETGDVGWWNRLFSSAKALQSDSTADKTAKVDLQDVMPKPAILGPDGSGIIGYKPVLSAAGKGNLLVVNRQGKGNLPPMHLRMSQAVVGPEKPLGSETIE